MKKIFGIIAISLLLSSKAYTTDLTGTKIFCGKIFKNYLGKVTSARYTAIEFLSDHSAKRYWLKTPKSWKIFSENITYHVAPDTIRVGINYIYRDTFIYDVGNQLCEIQSDDWNPKTEIKNKFNELIKLDWHNIIMQ